jgi:hypothetical protein
MRTGCCSCGWRLGLIVLQWLPLFSPSTVIVTAFSPCSSIAMERNGVRTILAKPPQQHHPSSCNIQPCGSRYPLNQRSAASFLVTLNMSSSSSPPPPPQPKATTTSPNLPLVALLATISFAYWYLLVFGAAANASGWPVPEWLPLTPGWPPSSEDLTPVLEDSVHFFYLSELIHNDAATYVMAPRLALFNFC